MEAIETSLAEPVATEDAAAPAGRTSVRRPAPRDVEDAAAPGEARRVISQFVRTGRAPEGSSLHPGIGDRLPVALFHALSSPALRSPYPVVIDADGGALQVRPLGEALDALADVPGVEGEAAELNRFFLRRVETALRSGTVVDPSLVQAWKAACATVRASTREDRLAAFDAFAAITGKSLSVSASLLPCEPETARLFARAVEERLSTERGRDLVAEADTLRLSLSALLEVEKEAGHDAVAPDRLRRTVGGALESAFDFDALSSLLDEAPHGPGMAPERRSRIESLVETLAHAATLFSSEVVCRLDEAEERMAEQTANLASLLRALETARLEAANRFRADLHGPLLDGYRADALSAEDLERCPPVVVEADEASLAEEHLGMLMSLLRDRRPFKVILTLRAAPGGPFGDAASLATGLGTAFVAQVALSDVSGWTTAVEQGFAHPGPALLALYAGGPGFDRLTPYLAAAAARDGRAVPTFVFRPTPGVPWADRLSVASNDLPDGDWLTTVVPVVADDDTEEALETTFTWIDHAACVPAFGTEFLPVPADAEPPGLVPVDRFLGMDTAERSRAFPYVLTVRPDGVLEKCVVTARLTERAEVALDRWRRLRELGGVGNSFAERAEAAAGRRFAAERDVAVAAAREAHAAEMDRAVSSLAESIVANIAASLLDLEPGTAPRTAPTRTAAPAAAAPAPAEGEPATAVAAPAAEPEEEPLVLDEAYIETPRCTSCNECTQLNGMIFGYNAEKQAYIKDASAGPYRDLVMAAEKCPVRIIHPGKPLNPNESGLDDLVERAKAFR